MANKVISGAHFAHVALKVSDIEKSVEFYKKLGFTEYTRWGEGDGAACMLDMGDGGILEIFAGRKAFDENAHFIHFALGVDSVDDAFNTAVALGARICSEPRLVEVNAIPSPIKINCAFVYGPDGEEIEFFKIVD